MEPYTSYLNSSNLISIYIDKMEKTANTYLITPAHSPAQYWSRQKSTHLTSFFFFFPFYSSKATPAAYLTTALHLLYKMEHLQNIDTTYKELIVLCTE